MLGRHLERLGRQPLVQLREGDLLAVQPVFGPAGRAADGVLPVVEREREGHAAVVGRHGLGVVDVLLYALRHAPALAADEAHPHALAVELVPTREQQALVELHEVAHLVDRSPPVLRGEGVDGEPTHAELEGTFDGVKERLLPRRVPLGALEALNQELEKEGEAPIKIGVGLAFGDAVVGNIGSEDRHDYAAIGDAVNMAAHIQEYSKQVPYDLLCTEQVRSLAGNIEDPVVNIESLGKHNLAKHGLLQLYGYRHQIKGQVAK